MKRKVGEKWEDSSEWPHFHPKFTEKHCSLIVIRTRVVADESQQLFIKSSYFRFAKLKDTCKAHPSKGPSIGYPDYNLQADLRSWNEALEDCE